MIIETWYKSFDSFRSVSAVDLVKLHDTISDEPLSDDSVALWETLRRRRNVVLHSVSKKLPVSISDLVCAILKTNRLYHSDKLWTATRLESHDSEIKNDLGRYQLSMARIEVSEELRLVEDILTAANLRTYFKFHNGRRYLCPACHEATDHHYADDLLHFAQLTQPRDQSCTQVECRVCQAISKVLRRKCDNPSCKGNVFSPEIGRCLTCVG